MERLVKKVVDSFVSLGLDGSNTNKACLDVYKEHFVDTFVDNLDLLILYHKSLPYIHILVLPSVAMLYRELRILVLVTMLSAVRSCSSSTPTRHHLLLCLGQTDGPEAVANEVTPPTKKKGFTEGITGGVKDTIPGEHQDKAKAHYSRSKEFIIEEYFPESRRDQWIARG
ncbi:hypothetical protein PM082_014735 [Marasmius tenuissimus]|nr:hypothetical protein PM082_014735 [Marasmius tenuissimus]